MILHERDLRSCALLPAIALALMLSLSPTCLARPAPRPEVVEHTGLLRGLSGR